MTPDTTGRIFGLLVVEWAWARLLEIVRGRLPWVVDLSPGRPVRISKGHALLDKSFGYICDVLPDGQHFAMIETDPEARVTHFNIVLNWFEELKRLVPPT